MGGDARKFSYAPGKLDLPDRKHQTQCVGRTSRLLGLILLTAFGSLIALWDAGCSGVVFSSQPPPPPPSPAITTSSLPAGQMGAAYQATLSASGGTIPYSWSLASGSLPAGLSLNSASGAISGTPSASGTSSFTVQVTDSASKAAQQPLSIAISASSPVITTSSLPAGQMGAAYQATLSASGGTTPYSWSLASGSLPAGLSLNSASGVISGTPSASGTSSFTVQVTDSASKAAQQPLSIAISASSPAIMTSSLPVGQMGTAYQATLAASGGTTPYSWSLASGSLPGGLSLNSTSGVISGTPSASGTSSFTVQVMDSASKAAQQALSIMVSGSVSAGTDEYGGVIARPCADQTKTDWNLQKVTIGGKPHWVFCTPAGYVFIKRGVYYITGDGHTDSPSIPTSYDDYTNTKYSGNTDAHYDLAYARLKGWGFNSGAPGAYRHATDSSVSAANKVPFTDYLQQAANIHMNCISKNNCKNIWNLRWPPTNAYDSNTAHNLVDAYDGAFAIAANSLYATDSNLSAFKGSPYFMGIVAGDTDNFSTFGAGTDFPTDPPGSYWGHTTWYIAQSAPRQTVNPRNSSAVFSDPTNYTKAQFATFLQNRYGTIGALNAAWGSSYSGFGTAGIQVTGTALSGSGNGPYTGTLTRTTSVDRFSVVVKAGGMAQGGDDGFGNFRGPGISSGTINYSTGAVSVTFTSTASSVTAGYYHDGWGVGGGLMDEAANGHAWFPSDQYNLMGATSAFKTDFDDFLQQYATQMFTVMKNAFKAQAPTKLFFGISNLGHVPGRSPARCPILKAAGAVLDVSQVSTDGSQAQMDFITNCLGDHPFTIWETVTANADSDVHGLSPGGPIGTWDKTTQGARGTQFQTDVNNLWNNCNSTTGSCQWVGYDWWAYLSFSFYEFTNFGLVSWRDNAYDGTEDLMNAVICSSPINAYSCGGETANYGNFLGAVTTANKQVDAILSNP